MNNTNYKILNRSIKLFTVDDFLTHDECDLIIKQAEIFGFKRSTIGGASGKKISNKRTSWTLFLYNTGKTADLYRFILNQLRKFFPKKKIGSIQISRYNPGQEYKNHFDSFKITKDMKKQRTTSAVIYLNNPVQGGATFFPRLNLRVYPRKGRVAIWDNLDSNQCRNELTEHCGEPVLEGTKYIISAWFITNGPPKCLKIPGNKNFLKSNKLKYIAVIVLILFGVWYKFFKMNAGGDDNIILKPEIIGDISSSSGNLFETSN